MTTSFVSNVCTYFKILILEFGVKCPANANIAELIDEIVYIYMTSMALFTMYAL